ncbi:MAG: FG-GAP repeat protein, partial [Oscillospiraceae bacterium]|nr:FG-GAP repeat protein [Oscillospiraceae bacterium]
TGPELEQEAESAQLIQEPSPFYEDLSPEEVLAIMQKIQAGDMSYIKSNAIFTTEKYERMFQTGRYELVLADINKDGFQDLVWRAASCNDDKPYDKPITVIISYKDHAFQPVLADTVDAAYFYILSENDTVISCFEQGGVVIYHTYSLYHYDEEWEETFQWGISAHGFYDLDELPEKWRAEHFPQVTTEGTYFVRFKEIPGTDGEEKEESITEEEFLQSFKEMTGFDFIGEFI